LKVCLPLMCKARRTLQFCSSPFTSRTQKYKCASHFYKLGPKNFIHCSFFYLSPISTDVTSNTLFLHTTLFLFPQLLSCSLLCSSAGGRDGDGDRRRAAAAVSLSTPTAVSSTPPSIFFSPCILEMNWLFCWCRRCY
jgi:hypothetical protein